MSMCDGDGGRERRQFLLDRSARRRRPKPWCCLLLLLHPYAHDHHHHQNHHRLVSLLLCFPLIPFLKQARLRIAAARDPTDHPRPARRARRESRQGAATQPRGCDHHQQTAFRLSALHPGSRQPRRVTRPKEQVQASSTWGRRNARTPREHTTREETQQQSRPTTHDTSSHLLHTHAASHQACTHTTPSTSSSTSKQHQQQQEIK